MGKKNSISGGSFIVSIKDTIIEIKTDTGLTATIIIKIIK